MKNRINSYVSFFGSLSLTLVCGAFLLASLLSGPLRAQTVDLEACVPTTEICDNSVDDDCDGLVDSSDTSDCSSCTPTTEICDNGVDDDCDGLVDNDDSDCGGGGGCFLAGTAIELIDGSLKPIEEVAVGDVVASFNTTFGITESAVVTETFVHDSPAYLRINGFLRVTGEHPLYVNGYWQYARDVRVGDLLWSDDNTVEPITSIEEIQTDTTVYNLSVTGNNNYFADGILAHNKGECTPNPTTVCGECTNGLQTCTFNNGCGVTNQFTRDCSDPVCGNGFVEPGEECDDNNVSNGDGCANECSCEYYTILGYTYFDNNQNGIREAGEVGLVGQSLSFRQAPFYSAIDYNSDGRYTSDDSSILANVNLGSPCPAGKDCDYSGNGVVNISDVSSFANYVSLGNLGSATSGTGGSFTSVVTASLVNYDYSSAYPSDDGSVLVRAATPAGYFATSNTSRVASTNNCVVQDVNFGFYRALCGNGVRETGEECDDGNTVDGDGCSASCQTEIGCGNGVLDPGEQCDYDTWPNACCSQSCIETLSIQNVSEVPSQTSAVISWSSPCNLSQPTSFLLEWGTAAAVWFPTGSANTTDLDYTLFGLSPNTVYSYRITAFSGLATASYEGTFQTLGGTENCFNGIDDNNNGLCDFLGSTCTDGSQAGDPACSCQANFECTIGACVDNVATVTCVDTTNPTCAPPYDYEQGCSDSCTLQCGSNEVLDPDACECIEVDACGNGVCEPYLGENPYTCFIDCPALCLSDWECGDWQPFECPESGLQTRICIDLNACDTPTNTPDTQQACSGQCQGLTCAPWQTIDLDMCMCEDIVPWCGNGVCESGETHQSCPADCVPPCTPNWVPTGWDECIAGVQTREYVDLNNCPGAVPPPNQRCCAEGCTIACGVCERLDVATQSCTPITPCCGDSVCSTDEGENVTTCSTDCGVPPEFQITLPACLDGLDNDSDGLVDFPTDPGCRSATDRSELNAQEVLTLVLDNPQVEQVNDAAKPILVAAVAVNTFTSFSFFNFASYLRYLFTQPFAAFGRRKRKKWGTVFNSLNKRPVELAIVRLYTKDSGQLLKSQVTDRKGRYSILAQPGKYYITVTKQGYDFPTLYLKGKREDVQFVDLYHGETIEVTEKDAQITVNIPVDPAEKVEASKTLILKYYGRRLQYGLAFSAVPLSAISLAISPTPLTLSLFGFHCLLYALFRRLGYQKKPKGWGVVYDETDRQPLGHAIARIYDAQYNKLLESQVTDGKGRYAFLVGDNNYYMTVEKLGYDKYTSEQLNIETDKKKEAVIDLDVGLEKEGVLSSRSQNIVDNGFNDQPPIQPDTVSKDPQNNTGSQGDSQQYDTPQHTDTLADALAAYKDTPDPSTEVTREDLAEHVSEPQTDLKEADSDIEETLPDHNHEDNHKKSIFG